MHMLMAAAAAFVLLHLLVAGTKVRDVATGAIGERAYAGLFSLASLVLLVFLGWAFARARGGPSDLTWWNATPVMKWIQLGLQLIATFFVVAGLTTPNPTSVGQAGALESGDPARGMVRITRHPFLWGVVIWSVGHLMVAGDFSGMVLFGALLVLAVLGTVSIDAKRRRRLGAVWDGFAARTSNLPFAAIAAGRQSLRIGEIGWWRFALWIAVWAGIYFVHPLAFGVSPRP
jgi:uncharacterized membrane protein